MSKPHRAEVYTDIFELKDYLNHLGLSVILTSGGFAPPHLGHFNCIQESAKAYPNYHLVVLVNGDGWLERKKGYVVMPAIERAEMIASIAGVDSVLIWEDGKSDISTPIMILQPQVFAKGGDRNSAENIPEWDICQSVGCHVVFGVGGSEKLNSSSNLIENILRHEK